MNIIRLTEGQKRCNRIEHPLLDHTKKMSIEDLETASKQYFSGDQSARDDIIMGHLYCIKSVVGRFLAHWPESQRFQDDMVSEGLEVITKLTNNLSEGDCLIKFRTKIWGKIQDAIEIMLNDSRSMFSASKRENEYIIKEGKEPEYNYSQSMQDGIDKGNFDTDPDFIDMMDSLEQFSETDQEHFKHLITQCMDKDHDIPESNLSEKDIQAIEAAARILGDL